LSFAGVSFNVFADLAKLVSLLVSDDNRNDEKRALCVLTSFVNVAEEFLCHNFPLRLHRWRKPYTLVNAKATATTSAIAANVIHLGMRLDMDNLS